MEGRLYSPQQRYASQQQQYAPPQQQYAPQQQQPQPHSQMQPQQQPNRTANLDVVRGSLQPASGSGNYGCSLDAAFAPTEEIQEQQSDSRLSKAGKIDQNDIESYLRMREKTGTGRGQPNVLQQ